MEKLSLREREEKRKKKREMYIEIQRIGERQ